MGLENYKEAFLNKLKEQLSVYVVIGSPIENPMWFQYEGVRDGLIRFISSQTKNIFFNLEPLSENDLRGFERGDYTKIYQYFRELKYDYIKEHWPTVYKQVRP